MRLCPGFLHDESAQDLIEYTLLLGFLVLASASLLINMGADVTRPWNNAQALMKHHGLAWGQGHGSGNPLPGK